MQKIITFYNTQKITSSNLSVLLTLLLLALSPNAYAQNTTTVTIGTGGTGGTYYPIGTAIAKLLSKDQSEQSCTTKRNCGIDGLSAQSLVTKASVQNVNDVQSGTMTMGITEASVAYAAFKGVDKFANDIKPDIRIIANLYPEDLHLVLSQGTELNSLRDLAGKRVGIDKPGSGTQVAVETILSDLGITKDKYTPLEISSAKSIDLMIKGQLDAYFYAAGTPVSSIIEQSKKSKLKLYSFSEEEIRRAGKVIPYYIPSTIEAGVYSGQDTEIKTLAVSALLITNANQPEKLIYDIVKTLWSNHGKNTLVNAHPKGKRVTLDTALNGLEGLNVPLHLGAEKFYKIACQFTVARSPERYKRYPIECSQ